MHLKRQKLFGLFLPVRVHPLMHGAPMAIPVLLRSAQFVAQCCNMLAAHRSQPTHLEPARLNTELPQ
jgi:hypothetical protein